MDYFDALGLAPTLSLDLAELERRFYQRSRELHPDRFTRASKVEQKRALEASSVLNDAYRTLRQPVSRAEYLLKAHGFDIGEQRSKDVPPELLAEVFELNMALEELKNGDETIKPQLAAAKRNFEIMLTTIDSDLEEQFARWDTSHSETALRDIRGTLNRRRYIENLIRDVNEHL